MSNRGLKNHCKFKTKYWQDRHQQRQQPLETIITGVKMQSPPRPVNLVSRNKRLKLNLTAKQECSLAKPDSEHKNIKARLKIQLLELERDSLNSFQQFRTIDTHQVAFQRNRYRGFTAQEKRQSSQFRPQTSLTIQVKAPGSKSFLMRQRLLLLQKKGMPQFMPLNSSICYSAKGYYTHRL